MIYREISRPSVLPVLLEEVKDRLRVADEANDAEIIALMQAATVAAENYTGRPFISRQYEGRLAAFSGCLIIEKTPVQSVDGISYVDADGAPQVLDLDQVSVDLGSEQRPARVTPLEGWPQASSVAVRFTAGYGDSWNDVPQPIRLAIMFYISHAYENREAVATGTVAPVPYTAEWLLNPYRVVVL